MWSDPVADRGGRIAVLNNETQTTLNALAEEAGEEPLRLLAVDSVQRPDVPSPASEVYPEFVAGVLVHLARIIQRQAGEIEELRGRLDKLEDGS